jgi:FMN phosphatase YigB (HAD superfamily)
MQRSRRTRNRDQTLIRGIVFDLFDTLVDQNHDRLMPVVVEGRRIGATTPALHVCATERFGLSLSVLDFAERLREVDRELRVDTIDQGIELSTLDRFVALGQSLDRPDVLAFGDALTRVHMGALTGAVTVPSHHEAVLASLAVEYPLALCSNFTHAETARSILREARFEAHLPTVLISEEVGLRKPRREIFEAVVERLGLAPAEILHVGDDLRADVEGAASVGMQTVWITRQVADPERQMAEYDGPRPDFALEDLMDLPVLVARLGA